MEELQLALGGELVAPSSKKSRRAAADTPARPSIKDQYAALGLGQVLPELYEKLIVNAELVIAPGTPAKDKSGILAAGKSTEWFPRRGTGKNKILLVGAYPSDEEKKSKKLLVGPSGQKLETTLAKMGIVMDDCWMTNVVRYYFPGGTDIKQDPINHGLPYLLAEIEYLKPDLILCLGGLALKALEGDVSLDNYIGNRWRPAGKTYDIAAVWQPAHVLRKPELDASWTDDIKIILGKNEIPLNIPNWRVQDQLPRRNITNLRALRAEIDTIIDLNEKDFGIDLEYAKDNPNTSLILNVQIATASRTLNLIVREGHWRPRIYLKTTGKDARVRQFPPTFISETVANEGYAATQEKTGWGPARIYASLSSIEEKHAERIRYKHQEILQRDGPVLAQQWLECTQSEEETAMTNGKVMVFDQQAELDEWLAENDGSIRTNLIGYVIGGTYTFDATEKEIGQELKRIINPQYGAKLRGQNGDVDWTRLEAIFDLPCADLVYCDTMTLAVLLDEGQPRGLENLSRRYLFAPNHKLRLLRHMENRGLKNKSYCFCRPDILNEYSLYDVRRTYDLPDAMLLALIEETGRIAREANKDNVPVLKLGQSRPDKNTQWLKNIGVNAWDKGETLLNAYFNYKIKQQIALCEPMLIGQPFNPTNVKKLVDWYEVALDKQLKKCQDIVSMYWVEPKLPDEPEYSGQTPNNVEINALLTEIATSGYSTAEKKFNISRFVLQPMVMANQETYLRLREKHRALIAPSTLFNPGSMDKTAYLLFYILGLPPITSTKGTEWNEVLHTTWVKQIRLKAKGIKVKPGTSGADLEILAEKQDIAKLLVDTRYIGTIVKSYMRKGGRWRDKNKPTTLAERTTVYIQDGEDLSDDIFAKADDQDETELNDATEKAFEDLDEIGKRDWGEYEKDQKSKAISLLIDDDNRIYSCYFPTLETQRLATRPNISAIIRGEARYVVDILGEAPPLEIRQLNEAPDDWFISSNDWKSAEVWMIAILARIRSKKRGNEMSNLWDIATDPKRDVHASTARQMFPDQLRELSDKEIKARFGHLRDLAKPVVFGIPYGRGAKAIATQLNREAINQYMDKKAKWIMKGRAGEPPPKPIPITAEQAKSFIDAYFELAPECFDFLTEQKSLVECPGFQINPWGFVRRYAIPNTEEELGEYQRQAANWQIQSGVACAMMQTCDIWRNKYRNKYKHLKMYLIDILHDATKFLFHKSMLAYHNEIIDDIMGTGLQLPFDHDRPLGFDATIYKAYERKEFVESIDLEAPNDPKAHEKTFLGKYRDTPENRALYQLHGRKADFALFLEKYGASANDLQKHQPLEVLANTP
jgi:DNA polymerase